MEAIELYTFAELEKLTTVDLIAMIADSSSQPFEQQLNVKQCLKHRMQLAKVPAEHLRVELKSERASSSRIYMMMLAEEIERLETQRNIELAVEKDDKRTAKITGRKKAYKHAIETLLRPDKEKSIFKIKKQWANTNYIETIYSFDYPSERSWFEDAQFELLQNKIGGMEKPYELFQKGSELRKAGFNGYLYNLKTFNKISSQLCWFAIYLNNVLEQQPNGEFWSMEMFAWGKRRSGR